MTPTSVPHRLYWRIASFDRLFELRAESSLPARITLCYRSRPQVYPIFSEPALFSIEPLVPDPIRPFTVTYRVHVGTDHAYASYAPMPVQRRPHKIYRVIRSVTVAHPATHLVLQTNCG